MDQSELNANFGDVLGDPYEVAGVTYYGGIGRYILTPEMQQAGFRGKGEMPITVSRSDFPDGIPFETVVTALGRQWKVRGEVESDSRVSRTYILRHL